MVETKSVKVDNWGVFFLQKLQNFFNKTDYCDLTLQFMDNSQLKVHRLVLSACTDYFNVLEQQTDCTDDILNMPYDLQADVVVPIVNFMYTGTLEFEVNMYGRLLKTAKDMNMTVLLKLLEAHKRTVDVQPARAPPVLLNKGAAGGGGNQYHRAGGASSAYGRGGAGPSGAAGSGAQRYTTAAGGVRRTVGPPPAAAVTSPAAKSKAGEPVRLGVRPVAGAAVISHGMRKSGGGTGPDAVRVVAKATGSRAAGPTRAADPRPTRFEADQGGDQMESSFDNISYESRPLNIKEESDDGDATSRSFEQLRRGYTGVKRPAAAVERATGDSPPEKKPNIEDVKEYIEAHRLRKKIVEEFNENEDDDEDDEDTAATGDGGKRNTSTSEDNLDHQKIISEVLKKYPHLVKSNKNIKLKITQKGQQQTITAPLRKSGGGNNASTAAPTKSPASSGTKPSPVAAKSTSTMGPAGKSQQQATPAASNNKPVIATPAAAPKKIDSKTMHALIAKGAENTTGPWLCLKCGVNGRPISIPSYKGFRRHLINVHKQKIDPKLCEHCGWRSAHKAELHHHVLVVHNISPPADVRFPKCTDCVYVAVDRSDLQAHQLDKHPKSAAAGKASQMLPAAQQHCIYCNKTFADETLLYEHIKNLHKERACEDGLMEDEDDEEPTTGSVGRRHGDDDDDDDDEDDRDDDEDYVPPKAVAPAAPISEKRKINVLSSITLPSKGGYVLDNKTRPVASTSTATIVQQKSVAVAKTTSGTSSGRRSGTLDPVTGTFADDDVDDADDDDADEEMPTAGAAKVIKAAAAAPAPEISQEEADSNAYLEFVMAEVHGEKKPCADAAVAAASPSTTSATDADVGTQFVTEEGAAVELTEEQKKELIDQLHDQSGVLLILKDEPSIADESSSTVANDTSSGDLPADTSASGKTADGASQSHQQMSMEWTLEAPQKSDDAAKSSATTAAKSSSVADKAKELIGDWSADETDDSMLDDSGKSATLETSTTAGEEATANTTTEQSKEVEDEEEEVAAAIGASTTTAAVAETKEAEVEVSSGAPLMPKRSYAGRGSRDSNKETDGEEATKSSAVTTKVVKEEEEEGDSSHIDEPKRDAETMKKDSNIEIKSLISDWGEDDEDEAMDKE